MKDKNQTSGNGLMTLLINLFPFIGFLVCVLMWFIDAAIDAYIIHPQAELLEAIFSKESTEIWMRSLIIIVMVVSAFFAQYMMRKQQKYETMLLAHKQELEQQVADRTAQLQQLANFDELTQIYNRRKFNELLKYEIERSLRYEQPLTLAMIDIDHFKNINDQYGHDEGDRILQHLAQALGNCLRKSDIYARWGGEEFIVLFPQTDLNSARPVSEKIHECIQHAPLGEKCQSLTVSIGISQFGKDDQAKLLLKRADEALYSAKQAGRNRTCYS